MLQREIDRERKCAADSQESFLVIARMMFEQLLFLSEEIRNLRSDLKQADRE